MLWAVEAPSRCILRADDASMRHNSYRFEKRDETSKTKSERIRHLGSGLAAVHEGAKAACVSPEKVASLILRCHSTPPRTIICGTVRVRQFPAASTVSLHVTLQD